MSKRFSRGKEKYEFFFSMVDNAFKTSASRRSKYGLKLGEGERYSDWENEGSNGMTHKYGSKI